MQITVENVSNVERRLTIVVPVNQIEALYEQKIDNFIKKAAIKGYRPGKAPKAFIEQRYGEDARRDALNEAIRSSLFQAISEKKLSPISAPEVEPKVMAPNQPLEFTASFEVMPEIEKVNFSMPSIEKLVVNVTDADITRVVEQLQKQYTKWNVVERAAQAKDRVVVDYYAIFDGKEDLENKVQNFPLEIGSNVMLPGFEDGLVGTKAGDEKTLKLAFPADFHVADRAGKPVEFVVQVKQVFQAEAPEVNEDFTKKLGVKSGKVDDLKEQIKTSLELERDRLVKEKLKEQVFRQILESNPLDVPKSLVSKEAKNIHDEVYPQHQEHNHHDHSEQEMTVFNEMAKKRVALGLLINEYSKQANIEADKERVQKRIMEIAASYENPQEVVAWLSSKERRSGIEAQVMEDQVLDQLLEGIAVTEKAMTYAELKGI